MGTLAAMARRGASRNFELPDVMVEGQKIMDQWNLDKITDEQAKVALDKLGFDPEAAKKGGKIPPIDPSGVESTGEPSPMIQPALDKDLKNVHDAMERRVRSMKP